MTYAVLGILVQLICKIIWNKKQQRQFKWKAVSADNEHQMNMSSSDKLNE